MKVLLVATNRERSPHPVALLGALCVAAAAIEKLDKISQRRPEWTSPAEWRRPIMRWAQKAMVAFDVRPQWKYISGYGQHMRPHLK